MEDENAEMSARVAQLDRETAMMSEVVVARKQKVAELHDVALSAKNAALAMAASPVPRSDSSEDRVPTEGGGVMDGSCGGTSEADSSSPVLITSPEMEAIVEAGMGQINSDADFLPEGAPAQDRVEQPGADAPPPSDHALFVMGEAIKSLVQQSSATQGGLMAQSQFAVGQGAMMMEAFNEILQNAKGLSAGVSQMLERFVLKGSPSIKDEFGSSAASKSSSRIDRLRDPSTTEIDIYGTKLPMGETKKDLAEFVRFLSLKHIDLEAIFRKQWHEIDEDDKQADAYVARAFLLCLVRTSPRVQHFLMQVKHAGEQGSPTSSGIWLLTAAMQFAAPKNEGDFKTLRLTFRDTSYFTLGMPLDECMLAAYQLMDDYCMTPRVTTPTYLYYAILSKVPTTDANLNLFLVAIQEHFNSVECGYATLVPFDYFLSQLCFKICHACSNETCADGLFAMSAECEGCDPDDGYDDYPLDGEASALWAARGKASMPGVRNGSRPTGSLPKGRLSTDPPPKRNCWDCGRVVPDCHPFGNGNCDRKCGSWDKPGCGHGFCPGNQGKPCIVRLKAKFKFPDVLNGAGRPLPERFVQVLIESQEEWHKTAAKKAMVAEVAMVAEYYGVDEADAEATLKESGNDL